MHRLILLLALLAWCLSTAAALSLPPRGQRAASVIDKPAVTPPFDEAAQDQDFQNILPLVPWTHERWDPGWLPQSCVTEAAYTGFGAAGFEAVEVWYEDCATSWTVCRHERADESWFYILDTLSQVPVGLRQYISVLVIAPRAVYSALKPPKELPFAYARPRTGVLTFMPSRLKLGVLFHETAHILDNFCPTLQRLTAPNTTAPNTTATPNPNTTNTSTTIIPQQHHRPTPFSTSPIWLSTLHSSPSLPTAYAATSLAESFADAFRWGMSHMTMSLRGGLALYSSGWEGCRGQVEVIQGLLRGVIWPAGGGGGGGGGWGGGGMGGGEGGGGWRGWRFLGTGGGRWGLWFRGGHYVDRREMQRLGRLWVVDGILMLSCFNLN
ncbi:hypothetical protein C8A05DRAFT_19148 [Staphylotrichum tortipilum]|uniref:Uncharacterized protein n=1 Tax=Staphylotrichum tortipilum TaxID=2831512 RepID=A0AAN6RQB5_9PEZI|nr:hypothetical protein C8A05DRAFT_19148 [Staphylotrichum longicolle]